MKFPALLVAVLMLAVLLVRFNLHFQKLCNTLAYNFRCPVWRLPSQALQNLVRTVALLTCGVKSSKNVFVRSVAEFLARNNKKSLLWKFVIGETA